MAVKERLGELHRDVAVLRRANTPPLGSRYEHVARDCKILEQQLEHHQIELEGLGNIFDALWEEQLCKIHVEKEIFHAQVNIPSPTLLSRSRRLKMTNLVTRTIFFVFSWKFADE